MEDERCAQNITELYPRKNRLYTFEYHAIGDYCMVISVLCDSIHDPVDVHISSNEPDAWYAPGVVIRTRL